jgi:hypothetical protein
MVYYNISSKMNVFFSVDVKFVQRGLGVGQYYVPSDQLKNKSSLLWRLCYGMGCHR